MLGRILVVVGVLVGGYWLFSIERSEPRESVPSERRGAPPPAMSNSSSVGFQPVINSPTFTQGIDYFSDPRELIVRRKEFSPFGQDWEDSYSSYSAAFDIESVATVGRSDEYYVSGTTRTGEAVIELWTIDPVDGGRYVDREVLQLPVGAPAPPAPSISGIRGGEYIAPEDRGRAGITRLEIYRGSELGTLWATTPDPNKRVLFALTKAGSLYQFDLTVSPSTPTLVMDAAGLPELAETTMLYPLHHDSLGVCYVAYGLDNSARGRGEPYVVFYDQDNDGVLDSNGVYTFEQFNAVHYEAGVLDDFLNYY